MKVCRDKDFPDDSNAESGKPERLPKAYFFLLKNKSKGDATNIEE